MITNSLIKEQKIDYAIKYNNVSDIIDLNSVNLLFRNDFKTKTFEYINEEGLYRAKNTINKEISKLILNNINDIEDGLDYFVGNFSSYKINEMVIYYLIELVVLLELKNKKVIDLKEFYKYLTMLDYISEDYLENFKKVVFLKKNVIKTNFDKNTNLLMTNKNSYEFPKNISNLKNKKIKLLINNLNLPLLEMPANKDSENIIDFLNNILTLKRSLKLKKWNFSLRIKKTKKDNQGMFIVNTNTIITDPRYPEAFNHELGHYVYENKLAFTFDDKRYYPSHFQHHIKKYKKENKIKIERSNLEKYSDDSEMFAYWFEKLIGKGI